MKNVYLYRYFQEECTLGLIKIEGVRHNPIFTLENPWLDNTPFISCVPKGEYICVSYSSSKFPDVWELQNVVKRDKILIHAGNYEEDTQGCILVGMGFAYHDDEKMITHSRKALNLMREMLSDEFKLTILEI